MIINIFFKNYFNDFFMVFYRYAAIRFNEYFKWKEKYFNIKM